MKTYLFILLFLPLAVFAAEEAERIKHYQLNPEEIYTIPVHFRNGVTTIMFPAEIESIHSANVALNQIPGGSNPSFLLAYTPGSYYFSVRALKEKAIGFINVMYGGKTYVLRLVENLEHAMSSVTFQGGGSGRGGRNRFIQAAVSPFLLKSCLDKAKAWEAVKSKYANDVAVHIKDYVSDYGPVRATVKKIWRFAKYDILVFYVVLKNGTDKPLYYNPQELALAIGEKKCFAALADASGEMPPHSESIVFLVVTGTHDGVRKLDAENDWKVLLFASDKRFRDKNLWRGK